MSQICKTSIQREKEIAQELCSVGGFYCIIDYGSRLNVSFETTLRSIKALVMAGKVLIFYSGAYLVELITKGLLELLMAKNSRTKKLLVKEVAKTMSGIHSVLLDIGSTTSYIPFTDQQFTGFIKVC